MRRIVADGEMPALVPERVWTETQRALAEREPRAYFEVLRSCGALAAIFPELEALYGVPQPPRWHPEVDTGLHAMLALEAAAQRSPEVAVRFAALVHDLGKALTPHDNGRVITVTKKRVWRSSSASAHGSRFRRRSRARDPCRAVARQGHRAAELRPATLLDLLEATDALRRRQRFERFLLGCEADARGRGPELLVAPYPQADLLREALAVAAAARPAPRDARVRASAPRSASAGEPRASRRCAGLREAT